MADDAVNLFVYGTLKSPATFRSVTGLTFEAPAFGYVKAAPSASQAPPLKALEAILANYDLVSPDQMYYYALEHAGRRVHGFLVLDVPPDAMAELAHYEGDGYEARTVTVMTEQGPMPATVFAGAPGLLHKRFGPDLRRDLKAELAFRARIDKFFQTKAARPYADESETPSYTRAVKELKGSTIRDLVQAHFQTAGLSDFFVSQALAGPVPSLEQLRRDDEAALFAEHYLVLLVRLVIFNQFEQRIRDQFRYEIDQLRGSDRYYEYTISCLAALRVLTHTAELTGMLVMDALSDLDFMTHDLVDFVEWAIVAADHIYDPAPARAALEWIEAHRVGGVLPLGAECDLSNLPHAAAAIQPPDKPHGCFDPTYNAFRYFRDFSLDVLGWKLGAHVEPMPAAGPGAQLFRLSLGSVGGELGKSNPITDDPWILNQVVAHLCRYFDIAPHALRISIQAPRPLTPRKGTTLDESTLRCLLALGGDVGRDADGRLRVRRISNREILQQVPNRRLDMLRTARRSRRGGVAPEELEAVGVTDLTAAHGNGQPVAQYRFLRLSSSVNYEPLILALKGVQLRLRPGEMLTAAQMQESPALAEMFDRLVAWAANPQPLGDDEIARFLQTVREGLDHERLGRSPHSPAYLNWAIEQLSNGLALFNRAAAMPADAREPGAPAGQERSPG
ncbi:MAG: hypothetical protein BIFFINMI_03693 [Phycisphaerae bacterium]|nr:hypothetical protein [Phycisphaerae bacterium]